MGQSNFDDVGDFHERFDLDNVTHRPGGVRPVDPEMVEFRIRFMHEELKEFEDAYLADSHAGMFDALLDLVYVALGTAHMLGYPWQEGWDAVQAANMQKVRAPSGADSPRHSPFDVIKPRGWTPPDLDAVLAAVKPTPPKCSQCGRDLEEQGLTHVKTNIPRAHVVLYCLCGHEVARRNIV